MPRQNTAITSWTKGEVSPLARGRFDVNLYAAGAETIENFIVRPQGPLFRRSGSKFVMETRDSASESRLIPFEVSDVAGYELLFGAGYIWVFKDRMPVIDQTTTYDTPITAIASSSGSFLLTVTTLSRSIASVTDEGSTALIATTTAHGYRTGSKVKISGSGSAALNGNTYSVTYVSTTTFRVSADPVGTSGAGGTAESCLVRPGDPLIISGSVASPTLNATWRIKSVPAFDQIVLANSTYIAPGGGASGTAFPWITEIASTFTSADLAAISYAQSSDVMYLAHGDHAPSKIQREDEETWHLSSVSFKDGPYLGLQQLSFVDYANPENGTAFPDVLFFISDYVHTATVNVDDGWAAGAPSADIGRYLEYRDGDQWRLALLTAGTAAALTGTVTILDNVLLHLDETTILTKKGHGGGFPNGRSVVPASEGNSAGIPSDRSGASGNSRPRTTTPSQQKIDPRDELQAVAGVVNSQYSNAFGYQDVGKYVRYHAASSAAGTWGLITGLVRAQVGKQVNVTAVTMVANSGIKNAVITNQVRTSYVTAFEGQVDAGIASGTRVIFSAADVGRKIRMGFGGRWAWGTITALIGAIGNTAASVQVSWDTDLPRDPHNAANIAGNEDTANPDSGWSYDWRLGAWGTEEFSGASYPTLHGPGYPRTVCFHEQRLVWGGSEWTPQTFWMSVSGDFENMLPSELDSTVLDDSAITYTLASAKANPIKWMVSGPSLTIGTTGGEWQVRASSSVSDAITPTNIKAVDYTSHGVADMLPARIGAAIVFVDRSKERVRELAYSAVEERYDSDDLTVISEHILRDHSSAVETCYQQNPHSIFWIRCGDGTLVGATINKKQEVIAWHHHTIASGLVKSISSIPATDGTFDEVWMVVARTISGATKRTVELLEDDFYPLGATSRLGTRFVDGHLLISGWTSTAISGLDHLEGLSVTPVVDGVKQAVRTVASGAITLDSAAATEVVVGLAYNSDLESLPPEGGSQFGVSQGMTKRVVSLEARLLDSPTISFGPNSSSLIAKTMALSGSNVWFTGTERLIPASGYDAESKWFIRQSDPYPLNILFVVTKLETNE